MSFNPRSVRLGKKAPRHDPRTLLLARYLKAVAPVAMPVNWSGKLALPCGMMMNDAIGDCTCAGIGHGLQVVTSAAGPTEVTLSDLTIEQLYEAVGNYVPGDESTDNGADLLSVLNYVRANGVGGYKLDSYAAVNYQNQQEVLQGLNLAGFLYCGVALPVSAQEQVGGVWDVDSTTAGNPGSWGLHCVDLVDADENGVDFLTWGAKQRATWAFFNRYIDESYAALFPNWIEVSGLAPSGFDLATLRSDIQLLAA